MSLRASIDAVALRWADCVLAHRTLALVASLALIAVLGAGLPSLRLETSFESYLPRDNSAQRLYEEFRREFGSGERIVVLIQPDELFDSGFLEQLTELHEALETGIPYLDDITSLVNARVLVDDAGVLSAEGLLDEVPRSDADFARMRTRLASMPIYRNVVISSDQTTTALVLEFEGAYGDDGTLDDALAGFESSDEATGEGPVRGELLSTEQAEQLVRAVDRVLAENPFDDASVHVAGTPLLAQQLGAMLTRDVLVFVTASIALTALLLAVLFGSVSAMLYPILIVVFSVIGTLGWMGHVGIPLTAVTEVLPSLLITIGVGDAIHIQAIFYKRRQEGLDTREAVRAAMGHSGLAVFLTSLTTAVSMAAFQTAELQPIIDLGRVAPFGVGLAFLLTITLLPVLLSWSRSDPELAPAWQEKRAAQLDAAIVWLGDLGMRRARLVVVAVIVLCALGAIGASRLRFSQDDLRWLPTDDRLRVGTEALNRTMGGGEPLELLIRLDVDHDIRDPDVMDALREIQQRTTAIRVGPVATAQTLSIVDILDETHRALLEGDDDPSGTPVSREAISQELLLFESAAPDDLAKLRDSVWRSTRMTMTVPFVDALYYSRFASAVKASADDVLQRRGLAGSVQVIPTGLLVLAGETFDLLFSSMARSYAIGFGLISLLMLMLIGSIRLGLMSWIPNIVPILLVLGLMGWLGAPLDISSMLVGGILIGVVVDDTIHFAHTFARYREKIDCTRRAVEATLETTGRAMLVTSIVLALGFFTLTGASLSNIVEFGRYSGIGVALAFLADIVILPALVTLANPCAPGCACGRGGG